VVGGDRAAGVVTPIVMSVAALDEVVAAGVLLPASLQWIERRPLQRAVRQASAGLVKAMIGLLPSLRCGGVVAVRGSAVVTFGRSWTGPTPARGDGGEQRQPAPR
jgi:hypothetical protein